VKDQIIECISLAFCKALPFSNFASNDISVEKNIEPALILININIINIHISFLLSIVKNSKVIISSTINNEIIKGLSLNLSIIAPENGAIKTAGKKCIAVTVAIARLEDPKSTSIVYIATFENHAPKYAIN
jgi:hypothetical protein